MPTERDLKRRKMPQKKPVPGYIWLLSALIIGLFVAFLMYLGKQPADDINFADSIKQELEKARTQKKLAAETKTAKKKAAQVDTKTEKKKDKTQFEFYTILSELEAFIPEEEEKEKEKKQQPKKQQNTPEASLNNKSTPNTKIKVKFKPPQKSYLLQAGSFKSKQDAERRKASLALLGVQSSIQSIQIKRDKWHRVRIGPFNDTARLHKTLNTLKQNNIQAMTMELK